MNANVDLGPLEAILTDATITEIMINGYQNIYVERAGNVEKVDASFRDEDHLMQVVRQIVAKFGQRIHQLDESTPILDVRLTDGSLMHVVGRGVSVNGTSVTIRKVHIHPLTADQLIGFGSWTPPMVEFLRTCVRARLNIVIAGGTSSGKTSVLNIVGGFIPPQDRIITIEEVTSVVLPQPHIVALETRPPNLEGKGEITLKHLVESALKMRPDHIILSEARGAEVLTLLQGMNMGYDGTLINIHATSVRDVLARLEMMATEGNPVMPLLALRHTIASAVHVICYQERLRDGTRRLVKIAEVLGMHGDNIVTQDIFEFVQSGVEDGKIIGQFRHTGVIPAFFDRLKVAGIERPQDLFAPTA
ncbi:MAG: CpaF family protein [Anaerolineae bacterium]|nr:CpaF family protein [Anaerolineae bacterium]